MHWVIVRVYLLLYFAWVDQRDHDTAGVMHKQALEHTKLEGAQGGCKELEANSQHLQLEGAQGGCKELEANSQHMQLEGAQGGCKELEANSQHMQLEGAQGGCKEQWPLKPTAGPCSFPN